MKFVFRKNSDGEVKLYLDLYSEEVDGSETGKLLKCGRRNCEVTVKCLGFEVNAMVHVKLVH